MSAIVITWMDGHTETYPDVTTSVRDGVLHVHQYEGPSQALASEWHFPISNIRCWSPEKTGKHHGTLSGKAALSLKNQ